MEIPPTIPSRGLNVFLANSSPRGTAISTITPRGGKPHAVKMSATVSAMSRRGAGLMAGSPGGTGSPFFVTRPTPTPRRNVTPNSSLQVTREQISAPCVTSGSSPASLRTLAARLGFSECAGVQDERDDRTGGQANRYLGNGATVDQGKQRPFRCSGGAGPCRVAGAQVSLRRFHAAFLPHWARRSVWSWTLGGILGMVCDTCRDSARNPPERVPP